VSSLDEDEAQEPADQAIEDDGSVRAKPSHMIPCSSPRNSGWRATDWIIEPKTTPMPMAGAERAKAHAEAEAQAPGPP